MNQHATIQKAAKEALGMIELLKRRKVEQKADYQGIGVRIDRPKGYVQTGKDESGATWERTYKTDYGYIPATEGGDAEELDAYLGPEAEATHAHWIVQQKADGSFDEFKLMLGFSDQASAKAMWSDHTPEKYYGGIVTTNLALVKSLLGVHPSPAPTTKLMKAFHCFDDDMRDWLDARGLLEESALPIAEAILKSADDATDEATRDLFVTKCGTFDLAMLMAAGRGESSNGVVRSVFGIEPVAKDDGAAPATGGDETSAALAAGGKLLVAQPKPKKKKTVNGFPVGESDDDETDDADKAIEIRPDVMSAVSAAFDRYLGPDLAARMKGRVAKFAAPTQETEELHYVLSIVLEPETVDAQDDIYDAETIRNAAWSYLINYRNAGLQHRVLVNYGVKIVESWIAPIDMAIGDQQIKAGTWIIGMYVEDDAIWAGIKSGELTGFSIGGVAERIPLSAA